MTHHTWRAAAGGAALALALLAAPAATAGTLYFSQDRNSNGLYTIDTGTGAAALCGNGETGVTSATVGLSPGDNPGTGCSGNLFGSKPFGFQEIRGDGSGASSVGSMGIEGMAYDALRGTIYGAINGSFFTVNRFTGAAVLSLPAPGSDVEGLAWDRAGGIFGLDTAGVLKFFDIALNNWSVLGATGIVNGNFGVGLAYDVVNDLLYAMSDENSFLYSIAPQTLAVTRIGDTGLNPHGGGLAYVEDGTPRIPLPVPAVLLATGLGGLAALRRAGRRA